MVCGAGAETHVVQIYLPAAVDGAYTDGNYALAQKFVMVSSTTFELPAPPVTYLPNGVEFAGWYEGTPEKLPEKTYWKGDEPVYAAKTMRTLTADLILTALYTGVDVMLADAADNGETLYQNNGKTAQTVTLSGRTLRKDGSWNTLCLPFDMTETQVGNDLAGAQLMTLSESNFNPATGLLTLNFAEAASIEAGKPYLVKWDEGDDIQDPVFHNVVVKNNIASTSTEYVDFVGIYSTENIYQEGEWNEMYLDESNTLCFSTSEKPQVNALRGYFVLKNMGLVGDVNDDGQINIADVTALVNVILGKQTDESAVESYRADINGNGNVTIADVTELVNIILGKYSSALNITDIDSGDLEPALEWGEGN